MSSKGTDLVRVNPEDKEYFESLARELNESMPKVIHRVAEEHRINRFLAEYDASYAALKQDPVAWNKELKDRELLSNTLSDGLKE